MAELRFSAAIDEAITEEMERDDNVFLMGEDVRSGLFGSAGKLYERLGENRVLDTPISENAFIGAAVGAAAVGMRPIVQSLVSFIWVAMDQLVSQAAKMRYMFGGQVKLPVVYRLGMYPGAHVAAHHGDRGYPMFMNMPGLKIVLPSTPGDAKGLLKTSIREDDPILFFEDVSLFGNIGHVPEGDHLIPLGVGDVKRVGTDVTVVALGQMVHVALNAAEQLDQDGVSVEIVDPRTLVPLDKKMILDSVAKTGRMVVVDLANKTCSAASEIAALVAEEAFGDLKAPIMRVATPDVHVPFSPPLEKLLYPDVEKVVTAIRGILD